jgi:hypothetical protein
MDLSLCVTAQSKAKRAPKLYVSQKFGLVVNVPPGLSFCPLPRNWYGSEEGTVLFLEPPVAGLASGQSSAMRPVDGFVPSITVRYFVNRSREDHYDGTIPRPGTSEEFARQFCQGPFASQDLKLFKESAFTCRSALPGDKVQIVLMAVYDSAQKDVVVTLLTTADRLTADKKILASLASGIATCQASSSTERRGAAACPRANWW